LGISAKRVAFLMLPIVLAACAGGDEGRSFSLFSDSKDTPQSFPANYRAELLAFMKTYLNNPVGVRDAAMAEPVMRDVNGKMRYVSCLRYSARESDGSYHEPRERAVRFMCSNNARPTPSPCALSATNIKSRSASPSTRHRDFPLRSNPDTAAPRNAV